jgi:hypothetical protein
MTAQEAQRRNRDARIALEPAPSATLLSSYASSQIGIMTGDTPRHLRNFWEMPAIGGAWRLCQTSGRSGADYDGYSLSVEWQDALGHIPYATYHVIVGREAWGRDSAEPLHVAVARLLDYHWPDQGRDALSSLADADRIVGLSPIVGENPAPERLRTLLAAAFGTEWSAARQERLLEQVGFAGKTLELWLRDGFFEQHAKLIRQRPFIWHIWDGRRDGFSVLVNYHKLDGPKLERLIYTYLGSWIGAQQAERDVGVAGADGRLVAALELQDKLKLIREGEKRSAKARSRTTSTCAGNHSDSNRSAGTQISMMACG